ncbi:MAG: hypothetical protein U0003_01220 [Vampirovibrionales bacterium]
MSLCSIPQGPLEKALQGLFPGKKAKLIELNMLGAKKAGYTP